MDSSDTFDVVQTVVRSGGEYLLAKRSEDNFWEFMGGKVKEEEDLKQAAIRELNEETDLELSQEELHDFRKGDSYRSEDDDRFRLNPVFFEVSEKKKREMSPEGLSEEHTDFEWIELTEFDRYDTLGQYPALEHLDVVNGRVALALVEKDGEFLVVKRSEENSTPGKWSTVSGGIEPGETPEDAAKRELREETGMEAEVVEKGGYYIGEGEQGTWRLEPVLMEYKSGEIDLNWELSRYRWVEPGEVENLDTLGKLKGFDKLGLR
ncbi:MAG: NUDIX domain-containing protein [Candidatus Nanohalobium sp.]